MEINRINGDVKGAVALTALTEGRMVCMASHSLSADLPAAKLPLTADEAKKARFMVSFPVTSQKPPFYTPEPSFAYAVRGGWDQASNVPFSAEVALTYPGYQKSKTIPSGTRCRLFGAGTFTVPSGQYIYSASLAKGASVSVSYAEATAGQLQYASTYDADVVVGVVEAIDSNLDLTVTLGMF